MPRIPLIAGERISRMSARDEEVCWMRKLSFSRFGLPMLALLAMGSWGNTPTPPLDSGAPGPVGNDGELTLEADGERETYLVQSALLTGDSLRVEGESVGGRPQFSLTLSLPGGFVEGDSLRSATLSVTSGHLVCDGEERSIGGGSLTISSASGSGPWEIDGEVALDDGSDTFWSGRLQARVRTA